MPLPAVALPLLLRRPPRLLAPTAVAAGALLVAELGAGGLGYGAVAERNPCRPPPTVPGHGLDPAAQRLVLRGLVEVACHTGRSREQLVVDLAARGEQAKRWVDDVFG